jgi:hypothetical protein
MKSIGRYIVIKHFFKDYCPEIKQVAFKARGKDARDKPIYFNHKEKAIILEGIKRMTADIIAEGSKELAPDYLEQIEIKNPIKKKKIIATENGSFVIARKN